MRCALLTFDYPPQPSGLGRAAYEIAMALSECGAEVVVFDASQPFGATFREEGILRIGCAAPGRGPFAVLRRRAGVGHLVAPLYFRKALLAAHRERPFDVVEATNWYAPLVLAPKRLARVTRMSTPAIDAMPTLRTRRDRLDLAAAHRMERASARASHALISNTAPHAKHMAALYGLGPDKDHSVIGLALSPSTLCAGRAAPWPPPSPGRVLFVGRSERRKGFAEGVAGFALCAQRRDGEALALDIVGVAKAEVRALAAHDDRVAHCLSRVRVHERIDDADLFALYGAASVVLAPSRYESYGLVYREAAAFGRPLVACAEDPSARAFLSEAQCGVLADHCMAEAVASALGRVLSDRALAERCRANGLAAAAALSREALGRQTLAVYRRAIVTLKGARGQIG